VAIAPDQQGELGGLALRILDQATDAEEIAGAIFDHQRHVPVVVDLGEPGREIGGQMTWAAAEAQMHILGVQRSTISMRRAGVIAEEGVQIQFDHLRQVRGQAAERHEDAGQRREVGWRPVAIAGEPRVRSIMSRASASLSGGKPSWPSPRTSTATPPWPTAVDGAHERDRLRPEEGFEVAGGPKERLGGSDPSP
jgi:hypothetical protein